MTIPERTLIEWSQLGETATQQQTFAEIREILTSPISRIDPENCLIYTQGSCLNETNIGTGSDVDLVVQLHEMPTHPVHRRELIVDLRERVLQTLSAELGTERVKVGKRTINVLSASGEVIADILPSCRHVGESGAEGIQFCTSTGEHETRFPLLHYQNGKRKNERTNGAYKKMVRVFKNARLHLPDPKLNRKRAGSSYAIECLIYNVPDHKFHDSLQKSYLDILVWLGQQHDLTGLLLQHEQDLLFGPSSEQWKLKKAYKLIRAYQELWREWR